MAFYGTQFYNLKKEKVEVIISTDPQNPAFCYNDLSGVGDYTQINLAGDEPITITQESDGIFCPIKSVGATITLVSDIPMIDLYNPTNQQVSVKILKQITSNNRSVENENLTRDFVEIEGESGNTRELGDNTSSTDTDTTPSSSEEPGDEPTPYNYNAEIIFTEIGQSVQITHYPALWSRITYTYNEEDYQIDETNHIITLLRSQPLDDVYVNYFKGGRPVPEPVRSGGEQTRDINDDPTSTTTPETTTTTPMDDAYVEATYSYKLNIVMQQGSEADEPDVEPQPFNPAQGFNVEDIYNMRMSDTKQVLFQGYVTPCEYSQDYNVLDEIELECVDCISTLKNMPFDMDIEHSGSIKRWIDIIKEALRKAGNSVSTRVGHQAYSSFLLPTSYNKNVTVDGVDNYCSLMDIYQDVTLFYDDDWKENSLLPGRLKLEDNDTWFDVLEAFCTTFSLSLIPYNGFVVFLDYFNSKYDEEEQADVREYYLYMSTSENPRGPIYFQQHGVIEQDLDPEHSGILAENIIKYAGEGGSISLDTVYNKIVVTGETKEVKDTSYEDEIENKSRPLSYCGSDYSFHKNDTVIDEPFDLGYNAWRQFRETDAPSTNNLYKFVYPYQNTNIMVGNVTVWDINDSTLAFSKQYRDPRDIDNTGILFSDNNCKYWTFAYATQYTQSAASGKRIENRVFIPYHGGGRINNFDWDGGGGYVPKQVRVGGVNCVFKYYVGAEWCMPIRLCTYENDNVPSETNFDNLLLMKCLYTGPQYETYQPGELYIAPRQMPMYYSTGIHTNSLTWQGQGHSKIVISGSVARSDTPWICKNDGTFFPAWTDTTYTEQGERYNFVNMMLYIEGDDGKWYYLTMTQRNPDVPHTGIHDVYRWEVRDSKIVFTNFTTFSEMQKYICRISLENKDDPKEGTYISFRNDVDYGWKLNENVTGQLFDFPNGLNAGKIYFIPMGDFNTTKNPGGYIWWKDIKVTVATRKDNYEDEMISDENIVYSQVINDDYLEKNEIELKINTQQSNFPLSYSSLINKYNNRDYSLNTQFWYLDSNNSYDIEEILGNKYYTYYKDPRIIFTMPTRGGILVPFSKIHENTMNKDFMVDSYSYNVKFDWNEVTFNEIPDSVDLNQTFEKTHNSRESASSSSKSKSKGFNINDTLGQNNVIEEIQVNDTPIELLPKTKTVNLQVLTMQDVITYLETYYTKKPDVIYEYQSGDTQLHGQTLGTNENFLDNAVWNNFPSGTDLSLYKRVKFYITPSQHNVGLSRNNISAAATVEVSLDSNGIRSEITTNYSGIESGFCLNNEDRFMIVSAMIRENNGTWQYALLTASLYDVTSTDVQDSWIYKIEGCFE